MPGLVPCAHFDLTNARSHRYLSPLLDRSGLLMQTDPEGITENRLAFSVIVGGLTTSIVMFTAGLFLRELWHQLMTALLELQAEEDADEEDELEDDDEEGRAGISMSASELMPFGGHRHAFSHDHEAGPSGSGGGGGGDDGAGGSGDVQPRTLWEEAAGGQEQADGAASPSAATPPPPGWTAQLSSENIGDAAPDALRT
jgi:hypothetical protein